MEILESEKLIESGPQLEGPTLQIGFEKSVSAVIFMLIINLVLHIRIKFGDMVVSHISTNPYKAAYGFLTIALIQSLQFVYLVNIKYENDFTKFVDLWVNNGTYNAIFMAFECCKFAAIIFFLNMQAFEFNILAFFVTFQNSLRLE